MDKSRDDIAEDVELARQLLEGTGYEVRRIRESDERNDGLRESSPRYRRLKDQEAVG